MRVRIFQPLVEGDLASVGLVNFDKKVPSKCNTMLKRKYVCSLFFKQSILRYNAEWQDSKDIVI